MNLETKPQVDRLGCWRVRTIAAGTASNYDRPCIDVRSVDLPSYVPTKSLAMNSYEYAD